MTPINDCAPSASPTVLSKTQAIELLLSQVEPLNAHETIATESALNRVLAAPVHSAIDAPGWDNSAMDGYAIRHADLVAHGGVLSVTQRITAGATGAPLPPGGAARIFTGAPTPAGADTVVVQEICARDGDQVRIPLDCKPGANIRRAGEEIRAGAKAIGAGVRLAPQHLGLAAAVGAAQLQVYRRLRVAIFSSGDELIMPGEPLRPGQIYNSNRFTLSGLLRTLGCEVIDLGICADTLDATCQILERAAQEADLILASGGVSVGEEDHIRPALERIGTLTMYQVAIRPGKPVAFGRIGATPFLGAPGNPVSLFVTFCLFARPLILRMQGVSGDLNPRTLEFPAAFDWPKPDKRCEFHRARLIEHPAGALAVEVFPSRSSALLSSLTWAEGLVEFAPGVIVQAGDPVRFIPFSELLR